MSILDDLIKGKKKDFNLRTPTRSLSTLERITRKDVKKVIEKTPTKPSLGSRAKSFLGKATSFVSKANQKLTKALSFGRPTTIEEAVERKEELPTIQRSFVAGIGDIMATAGATANWLGKEGIGTKLMKEGAKYQSIAVDESKTAGEFDWKDMYDPSFYVTTVARSVPFTLALIPTAVIGAYAGTATAGAIGLGAFGTIVLGSIGAATLSRPVESALEAGGVYDEQIAKGKSKEEADVAADKVFKRNLSLVGMDATEFALAFAPTPKGAKPWVRALLKMAGVTGNFLMEGSEEVIQGAIGKAAQGEEIDIFGKESQQEFAIGGIMGAGHGVAGGIFNQLKGTVAETYQEEYQSEVSKNMNKGDTEDVAEIKALDTVTERHPKQVEKLVENTVKDLSGVSDEQVAAIEAEEVKALKKVVVKAPKKIVVTKVSAKPVVITKPKIKEVTEKQIKTTKNIKDTKTTLRKIQVELSEAMTEAEASAIIAQEKRAGVNVEDINKLKRIYASNKKFQEGDIETIRASRTGGLLNRVIENVQEIYPNMNEQEALDFALQLPTKAEEAVRTPTIRALEKKQKKLSKFMDLLKARQTELNIEEDAELSREWTQALAVQEKLEKIVKIPRRQLPVGEGKEKVSRLQARLKGALENASEEDIEELGLTTFRQMNQEDQIAKASEFVEGNTEEALKVVRGEIDPPEGILQNSVFAALIELGKVDTDVATQVATLTATRFGQEINILKKILADNPVVMMQDIVQTRIEAYEKRTGRKVTERVKTETERIAKKVKPTTKEQWNSFIESIRC